MANVEHLEREATDEAVRVHLGHAANDDSSHLSSNSKLVNGRFMNPPIAARPASTITGRTMIAGVSCGG